MEFLTGLLTIAVPAIAIGYIVLARTQPVLVMYIAALIIGLGYLSVTGAVSDIGQSALSYFSQEKSANVSAGDTGTASPAPSESAPAAAVPAASSPSPTDATSSTESDTPPAGAAPNAGGDASDAAAPTSP